jgi:hypothetical protein
MRSTTDSNQQHVDQQSTTDSNQQHVDHRCTHNTPLLRGPPAAAAIGTREVLKTACKHSVVEHQGRRHSTTDADVLAAYLGAARLVCVQEMTK